MDQLGSFGNWELKRKLGAGGFGEVMLWQHRISLQEIATKRLKENNRLREDEAGKLKERWQQEHEWMRNLNTPYIVRGIDVNDDAFVEYINENHAWRPLPVIVMEYCNGGDLRTQLQRGENTNGLHECEVRDVMYALRHAVEYLHEKCRIEHRDLKPDNIVIQQNGRQKCYKLTDFGFARESSPNTIAKSVVGTRHYFAPEVVDTSRYTKTVDYWSLGVIAFELMCGSLPFIPHTTLYDIITNIKNKPRDCIAITEDIENPKKYDIQKHIFAENRMSSVFVEKIERWLRLALDSDYKTRGKEDSSLKFYTELDAILASKILTVFCPNTCKFYAYEVSADMSMSTFVAALERDTALLRENFFFVLPTKHPHTINKVSTPMDLFVDEWQDTRDSLTPPAMLYLVGYQCDYNAADPIISPLLKRLLQMSAEVTTPEWLAQKITQHSHFLLANEQRHLEALLDGMKEYAMTVECEIAKNSELMNLLQTEIVLMRGVVKQFLSMISAAKVAMERKLPYCGAAFDAWLTKANNYNTELLKVNEATQKVQTRYYSVVRRIKELATTKVFDELPKRDIYELAKFRKTLQTAPHSMKTQLVACENAVYNCLKQRHSFLCDPQLKIVQKEISGIHLESRKIEKISLNTRKLLTVYDDKISRTNCDFQNFLVNLRTNGSTLSLSPLKTDGEMQTNGLCETLQNSLLMNTSDLIEQAMSMVAIMENNLPATIDNDI